MCSDQLTMCTVSSNIFKTYQINGQRITINRVGTEEGGELPGSSGAEVFIGHLPRDLLENELLPVLLSVGQLLELRIMMNFSGNTRGFAFARYATQDTADRAVRLLNNFEIRAGRRMVIIKSRDKKKLFVGRLPTNMKEEAIVDIMRSLTENIRRVEIHSYVKNGTRHRYSIIEYQCHMDACRARRVLFGNINNIFQGEIQVDWANSKCEMDDANDDFVPMKRSNRFEKKYEAQYLESQNQPQLVHSEGSQSPTSSEELSTIRKMNKRNGIQTACQICGPDCSFTKGRPKTSRSRRRLH